MQLFHGISEPDKLCDFMCILTMVSLVYEVAFLFLSVLQTSFYRSISVNVCISLKNPTKQP